MFLSSCGSPKGSDEQKELNFSMDSSPVTIDPQLVSDTGSSMVVKFFTSTLYEYNQDRELVPGLADSFEESDDGLKVTYHLKNGIKWSDGNEITAEDFVCGFQRLADPETKSNSVYLMTDCCMVKNAQQVSTGKMPVSELGVSAPDHKTFVVELEQPCPYLNSLFSLTTFSPCSRDFLGSCGDEYATKPDTVLSSGPYILDRYEPIASQIHLYKNPYYYGADKIEMQGINIQVVGDTQQAMMCYESGALDIIRVSGELAELAEGDEELESFSTAAVYKLELNHKTNKFLKNRNIRLALAKSIDRESIAKNVLRLGYLPMTRVIPTGFYKEDNGNDFAQDAAMYDEYMKCDAEQAAQYWAKGLSEVGESSAKLDICCNSAYSKVVEAIKQQAEKTLPGLEITITVLPPKEWMQKLSEGTGYDIILNSWVADYSDPTALFQSCLNTENTNGYSSDEFSELYSRSITARGAQRDSILHDAETLLMKDIALIPLFSGESCYLVANGVSGLHLSPTGSEPIVTGFKKEMK